MTVSFYALAIAGAAIIYLLIAYSSLSGKFKRNEFVQYVNTAGITKNPPSYVETWEGKTINFRVGKYTVSIPQVRPRWCFQYINQIASDFSYLQKYAEISKDGKLSGKYDDILYGLTYKRIVNMIYDLSKHFVKGRRKYKKALMEKANSDVAFTLNLCMEISDYWLYVKKKLALLSNKKTERQMVGATFADSSLQLDGDGKMYAIPRYESHSNTVQ